MKDSLRELPTDWGTLVYHLIHKLTYLFLLFLLLIRSHLSVCIDFSAVNIIFPLSRMKKPVSVIVLLERIFLDLGGSCIMFLLGILTK